MAVDFIGDGLALRNKGEIATHDGTAPVVISPGTNGQILTAQSSASYGLVWTTPTTNPDGPYTLISTATITANTATVDITGIPGTYFSISLVGLIRSDSLSTSQRQLRIRINGATTNYIYQYVGHNGVATRDTTSGYILAATSAVPISASGQDTEAYGAVLVEMIGYASNTTDKKMIQIYPSGCFQTGSGGTQFNWRMGVATNPNIGSAISSIQLFLDTDNIASGSVFYLYGVKDSN
jgi:hypothetical protein